MLNFKTDFLMKKKTIHVVPHNGKWATRTGGNQRVTQNFETQSDAIEAGRQQAINNTTELKIHNKQGKIRESNSYGNDPKEIKG